MPNYMKRVFLSIAQLFAFSGFGFSAIILLTMGGSRQFWRNTEEAILIIVICIGSLCVSSFLFFPRKTFPDNETWELEQKLVQMKLKNEIICSVLGIRDFFYAKFGKQFCKSTFFHVFSFFFSLKLL